MLLFKQLPLVLIEMQYGILRVFAHWVRQCLVVERCEDDAVRPIANFPDADDVVFVLTVDDFVVVPGTGIVAQILRVVPTKEVRQLILIDMLQQLRFEITALD